MRKLFYTLSITAFIAVIAPLNTFANDCQTYVTQEKQYKKINVSDIPKDVLDKIKKQYGTILLKKHIKLTTGNTN